MTFRAAVRRTLLVALAVAVAVCAAAPADAAAKRTRRAAKRPAKPVVQPAPPAPAPAALAQTEPVPMAEPAPEPPPRDPWREARELADRGQPDSAIAVLREVLAADPLDFGLRWLEAGLVGEAGRHAESAALFDRLAAEFPARAGELLSDRAAQRLEAGDARGAAADLQAWLADQPEDADARRRLGQALVACDDLPGALAAYETLLQREPSDTDAALERARVLGWLGRHRDAITAYETLLQREPGNTDAELGLAQNESWSGDNRRASQRLESLVAREPGNAEAWKVLAHARYWDDDPDGALAALAKQRELAPGDAEATALSQRIAREQRARLELGHGRSNDSDGLGVLSPAAEFSWPLGPGLTGNAGWRYDRAADEGGESSARQLMAGLRRSWGPVWTGYARAALTTWATGSGAGRGGELGAIMRPTARLRLEAVTAREPVITRLSLEEHITMLQWVLAADWDVRPRLLVSAQGRAGSYSDGNRSERTSFAARWQFRDDARWEVAGRLGLEQLNVHQDLDHGYYDPDFYREWGPAAELAFRPAPRWRVSSELQAGWQREKGSPTEPFYGVEAGAEFMPDLDWTLGVAAGRGDSNLQNASGYQRGWWRLTVVRAF